MYASRATQFIVGLFAIVGISALAVLAFSLGEIPLPFFAQPTYTLYANFDNITGLKPGDSVDISGVKVGKVDQIGLKDFRARVKMSINQGIEVDRDAIAGIKTEGLLGNRYIAIALGPSDKTLRANDTIRQTESAFVLEDAIGQIINNIGSGGSKDSKEAKDTVEKQK